MLVKFNFTMVYPFNDFGTLSYFKTLDNSSIIALFPTPAGPVMAIFAFSRQQSPTSICNTSSSLSIITCFFFGLIISAKVNFFTPDKFCGLSLFLVPSLEITSLKFTLYFFNNS